MCNQYLWILKFILLIFFNFQFLRENCGFFHELILKIFEKSSENDRPLAHSNALCLRIDAALITLVPAVNDAN